MPIDLRCDWSAPWLAPFAELRPLAEDADWRRRCTDEARRREVRTAGGLPLVFAAADDAGDAPYEAHIAATGRVPSRDNAHDLINALAWLVFPRSKAALNERQADELARDGVSGRRGPVRDAATLIDESGLLLAADERACAALAQLDWPWLFGARRACWHRDWRPHAFGHALIEKLAAPYKRLTAVVVCLPEAAGSAAAIDEAAARFILRRDLAPPLLAHLPVLGIPGWWRENEAPGFYDDPSVFRVRHGKGAMAGPGA